MDTPTIDPTTTRLKTSVGPHAPTWECATCADAFPDVVSMLTARDIFFTVEHIGGFVRFVPSAGRRWQPPKPLSPAALIAGLAVICTPDCDWCTAHPEHAHPYRKGAIA